MLERGDDHFKVIPVYIETGVLSNALYRTFQKSPIRRHVPETSYNTLAQIQTKREEEAGR